MDTATRQRVRVRANHRCEYCRLHEDDDIYTFHVEHIVAIKHGGSDVDDNLALSCQQCNLHKGPNLAGIDPETGTMIELFHPRNDVWRDHFDYGEGEFIGLTAKGRATVAVLNMNDSDRIEFRKEVDFEARQ